ncbi:HDOD domain-containing protein [Candidatus Latescibacterota bacterium]
MSRNEPANIADEEFGLIVHQGGSEPQDLVKFLSLHLNYLYGYNLILARSLNEATALSRERGAAVRLVFVVQDKPVGQAVTVELSRQGEVPLFLLLPQLLVDTHQSFVAQADNVYLRSWEESTGAGQVKLRELIAEVFQRQGIGGLFDRAQHVSYRVMQQRVEKRLKHLHTLPTLPEVVLRIMEVISDTESTPDDLEEVLQSDPAIVHKLLQVVNTPAFAGAGHRGDWTLKEAIVRLGRRKLGSVALQIKLINSLVKPEESHFDLRRFWVHSVGCAHIADRLYADQLVEVGGQVGVNEYWIAALLHDVGKLVLGFFFWSYFERVSELIAHTGMSFRDAESRLGDIVTHQQVGQLLLMQATMGEDVVKCVGMHHETQSLPSPLTCLIHLANNLCKDLGLGCLPEERGQYDPAVLRVLGVTEEGVRDLKETVGSTVVPEIMDVVDRCTRA